MPLITMKIASLPKEQKAELAQRMTQLASEITGIPEPAFTMFVEEYATENIAVGGKLLSERK
mgnify:FL=1